MTDSDGFSREMPFIDDSSLENKVFHQPISGKEHRIRANFFVKNHLIWTISEQKIEWNYDRNQQFLVKSSRIFDL